MKLYPGRPGDDVTVYTLEGAKWLSRNCPNCIGHGMAPIYQTNYMGEPVEYAEENGRLVPVLMRALAYCICPAGRKIMILHQSSGEKRLLLPDFHDVVAGKHYGWTVDDPTDGEQTEEEISALPSSWRDMIAKRVRAT